jgi:hypothetical protein
MTITLSQAQAEGRLAEFIEQEEARGIGPALSSEFDAAVKALTQPTQEGRTSRSPSRGGSTGK